MYVVNICQWEEFGHVLQGFTVQIIFLLAFLCIVNKLGLKGVQIFVTGYSICQNRPVTEYSYVDTEVPAIVQVPVDSDAHGESSFCFHSPVQNITLSVLLGGHSR